MEDSNHDTSQLSRSFGATIRRLRKARAWSQADLGERLGTSLSTVSKLENGRTTTNLDHLALLARAFDTTPDALLAGHADAREGQVLAAIRAGDTAGAVEALAEALGVGVEQIGLPSPPEAGPNAAQFEALGRHAAQLARSAAAIVAATSDADAEALLSAWVDAEQ